jgi:hypothetical protein
MILKKRTFIYIVVFFLLFVSQVKSQDYKTGIGLRLGYSPGVTVKHFILERLALEAMFTTRPSFISINTPGATLTVLAEYHFYFKEIDNFSFFVGGGLHSGFWQEQGASSGYALLGIDAIVGIEYLFPELPLAVQVDLKPNIDFWEFIGWFPQEIFSISLRYSF